MSIDRSSSIEADDVAPGTAHPPHVHPEGVCPSPETDTNYDEGFDVGEGAPVFGEILLSLDGDLMDGDLMGGGGAFPELEEDDDYTYEAEMRLAALAGRLQDAEFGEDEPFVGFDGDDLDLANRTLVIHGVDPDTELRRRCRRPQVFLPT